MDKTIYKIVFFTLTNLKKMKAPYKEIKRPVRSRFLAAWIRLTFHVDTYLHISSN